jgi:hypothetical protein
MQVGCNCYWAPSTVSSTFREDLILWELQALETCDEAAAGTLGVLVCRGIDGMDWVSTKADEFQWRRNFRYFRKVKAVP